MLDFHPDALAELRSGLAWYQLRSPLAAAAFLASVRQTLRNVEEHPERTPHDADGFRSIRVRKFPFQIVYRRTLHGVRIVAVAHTSQRPNYWRDR